MALSLISLNIEASKHLDRVLPFVRERQPDVLCVQEVVEKDMPELSEAFGAEGFFVPELILSPEHPLSRYSEPVAIGIALFSRFPVSRQEATVYHEGMIGSAPLDPRDIEGQRRAQSSTLILAEMEKEGERYRIGTTHFTWSPNGMPNAYQREDMEALLALLRKEEPLALCGDFNAPRGGEMFARLAERYADAVPPEYRTSIDARVHSNGKEHPEIFEDKMVDGLFLSPGYTAHDVALEFGLSDHAAVVASLERVS